FPARGHGVTGLGRVAQVWLTGGDINAVDDDTVILQIAGSAQKGSDLRAFTGTIRINQDWMAAGQLAGAAPPCKQRLVPVPTQVRVEASGGLLVRVDPRILFAGF